VRPGHEKRSGDELRPRAASTAQHSKHAPYSGGAAPKICAACSPNPQVSGDHQSRAQWHLVLLQQHCASLPPFPGVSPAELQGTSNQAHTHTLHQLCGPSGTRAIPNFMNQKHTPGFHAGEGGFFPAKDLLIPLHKIPHTTQHQTQGCISSSQDQHKASPAPSHPQHTHTQMHAWGRAKRITTHQCSRHMPSSQPGPLACALSGRGCPPHRIGWLAGSPHSHTAAHTCTSVQQPCC